MGIFDFVERVFKPSVGSRLDAMHEKERKRAAEAEALEYMRVQRERTAAMESASIQKRELEDLKKDPQADPAAIGRIEEELRIKDSLLSKEVLALERNEYNGEILDSYARELEERAKVQEVKSRIKQMEQAGTHDKAQIDALKAEVDMKSAWMNKDVLGKLWPEEET